MKDNWTDFEKHVVEKLEKFSDKFDKISDDISNLKGRAAVWGLIAGAVAAGLVDALVRLKP